MVLSCRAGNNMPILFKGGLPLMKGLLLAACAACFLYAGTASATTPSECAARLHRLGITDLTRIRIGQNVTFEGQTTTVVPGDTADKICDRLDDARLATLTREHDSALTTLRQRDRTIAENTTRIAELEANPWNIYGPWLLLFFIAVLVKWWVWPLIRGALRKKRRTGNFSLHGASLKRTGMFG